MNTTKHPDLPAISAKIGSIGDPERLGDNCYADYTVELTIGDEILTVDGWALCGWLAPGAHADLDGSGLAVWGDAQHGGWTSCSGDGATNGLPRTSLLPAEYDEPISVGGAEGRDNLEIGPEHWPVWEDAIRATKAAEKAAADAEGEDTEDALLVAAGEAATYAAMLRDRLDTAIQDALPDSPDIPEPEAEEVWDAIAETDVPGVRLGDYAGAGLALAWRVGDTYEMIYWPDESDARRAVEAVGGSMVANLVADIKRASEREY